MENARQISVSTMLRRNTVEMVREHKTPLFAAMLMLLIASESWSKLNYEAMIEEALAESGITLLDWCRVLENTLERHAKR